MTFETFYQGDRETSPDYYFENFDHFFVTILTFFVVDKFDLF